MLTKDLETGNKLIDDQHRQLLNLADKMQLQHGIVPDPEEFLSALRFLKKYIYTHLADEEGVMEACAYAGTVGHREVHQRIRQDLEALIDRFITEGATRVLRLELYMFVFDRFVHHIRQVDKPMAAFCRGEGS